jgi:hypothetical protein
MATNDGRKNRSCAHLTDRNFRNEPKFPITFQVADFRAFSRRRAHRVPKIATTPFDKYEVGIFYTLVANEC